MRSNIIKKGFEKAPHRSLLKATGSIVSNDDFRKPFIGICNSYNELIPGHAHLQELGKIAKEEVRKAGGVPFEFNTIWYFFKTLIQPVRVSFVYPTTERSF